jgi:hypothetical protein
VRRDGRVQPLRAQPGQVGRRGLAAGQDDPIDVRQRGRAACPGERTPGTFLSGWNSSRLLMRGYATMAMRVERPPLVEPWGDGTAIVEHPVFLR